jgi:hypothetical protein
MAVKVLAFVLAFGLVCAGCSQPAAQDPAVTNVKDGCDQAPDLAFRNKVAVAPPFRGAAELDNDELLLTVDAGQWNKLGLGMQQQIVAVFDCGDAGPGRYHSNIYVRAIDGTDLMKVSTPELMQFRASGLATLTPDGLHAESVAADATARGR